mmetsp:Transcript_51159/g.57949  ORF Transcript_51159/g.57949 Transcript_51159/m.57949 type:complete len:174 (-) Transcript_51159:362-883(-)
MVSCSMSLVVSAVLLLLVASSIEGFTTIRSSITTITTTTSSSSVLWEKKWGEPEQKENNNILGTIGNAFGNFFEELDAFVDDATARRLGNGAAYYGKRKSSFYGSDDKMKKLDRNVSDSEEDFMVNAGSNFKWIKDEQGQLRPVSRMKNASVENPASFWGRKDGKEEKEESSE